MLVHVFRWLLNGLHLSIFWLGISHAEWHSASRIHRKRERERSRTKNWRSNALFGILAYVSLSPSQPYSAVIFILMYGMHVNLCQAEAITLFPLTFPSNKFKQFISVCNVAAWFSSSISIYFGSAQVWICKWALARTEKCKSIAWMSYSCYYPLLCRWIY